MTVECDDAKLLRFTEAIRRGFLDMMDCTSESMCVVLCVPLVELMDMIGLSVEVRMSFVDVGNGERWNHFWIRLPDGRALDPNADQFNAALGAKFPTVYLDQPSPRIHG